MKILCSLTLFLAVHVVVPVHAKEQKRATILETISATGITKFFWKDRDEACQLSIQYADQAVAALCKHEKKGELVKITPKAQGAKGFRKTLHYCKADNCEANEEGAFRCEVRSFAKCKYKKMVDDPGLLIQLKGKALKQINTGKSPCDYKPDSTACRDFKAGSEAYGVGEKG